MSGSDEKPRGSLVRRAPRPHAASSRRTSGLRSRAASRVAAAYSWRFLVVAAAIGVASLARHPAQAARHPAARRDPRRRTAVAGLQLDAAPPLPEVARDHHRDGRRARDRRWPALARRLADHAAVVVRPGRAPSRRATSSGSTSSTGPLQLTEEQIDDLSSQASLCSRSRPSCCCRARSRRHDARPCRRRRCSSRSSSCCASSPTAGASGAGRRGCSRSKARPAVDGAGTRGLGDGRRTMRATQMLVATIDADRHRPRRVPARACRSRSRSPSSSSSGAFIPIVGAVVTGAARGLPRARLQRSV